MEAQYYTPELNEFYDGFEYEELDGLDEGYAEIWKKQIFDFRDLEIIDDEIREKKLRVKCLDKEDVLSLGWKDDEHDWYTIGHNYALNIIDSNNTVHIMFKIYREGKVEYNNYFSGYCKNKSELKKLMVQTGILEK